MIYSKFIAIIYHSQQYTVKLRKLHRLRVLAVLHLYPIGECSETSIAGSYLSYQN